MTFLRCTTLAIVTTWSLGALAQEEAPAEAPPAAEAEEKPEGEAAEGEEGEAFDGEEAVSDAVFEEGIEAYREGKFAAAADKLYEYMDGNAPEADHYEWSEYYLGRTLLEMNLVHGGVEYLYNVAKERKRPELLPDALRELEQVIAVRPHDRVLIVEDLVGSTDFGALPPDVQAFVAYQKGRRDLIDGRLKWARLHFDNLERLKDENELAERYLLRARFAKAIVDIKATHARDSKAKIDKRTKARTALEEIIKSEIDDYQTKNEAAKVVARLYFEEERYPEALKAYDSVDVPFLSEEEASIFLEKAWTRYFAGDARGALGILLSLEAPSYRKYFFPEAFVLKALSFQQLCHYAAAKGSAREFLRRYGDALNELRRTRDPLAHPVLRRAAVQTKKPRQALEFLSMLKAERERAERLSNKHGLRDRVISIYDEKIAQMSAELDRVVRDAGDRVAGDLLDYEEQARLVDYEVSLEVFRRLKKGTGKKVADEQKPIPLGSDDVYYPFDVEYWNDELHNYRFRIKNRCFGGELFQ
jgi:hypothetical protein